MQINEQFKKYWWLLLIVVIFIVLMILVLPKNKLEVQELDKIPVSHPTAVELEYLTSTELDALGVDPSIKAQVIRRDPLVYKVINDETDIVKDLREIEDYR